MIDPAKVKLDFPIFKNYPSLIYLDNAATSQKPQQVIDAVSKFYERYNANIHRGIYKLAEDATDKYEAIRIKVSKFIGSQNPKEIIFTKNTNESINLVAQGWGKQNLKSGDIVVLSEMEHHANIVPWIRLKDELGVVLHYLPISSDFKLDYKKIENSEINFSKIKLVSLTHISNVLGTINPIAEIIAYFKKLGINAKFCIDGAQSVPHMPININNLGCDFLAFSSHKMLGPSGVGVLWTKSEILQNMEPLLVGSHIISNVSKDAVLWTDIPDKFEVGTGNLEGVYGLEAAIDYLTSIGMENVFEHDKRISEYFFKNVSQVKDLNLFGPQTAEDRLAIFSFGFEGIHPHDISQVLDEKNIAIRSGHHCAQILMDCLKEPAAARASAYIYNSNSDIETFIKGLLSVKQTFKI